MLFCLEEHKCTSPHPSPSGEGDPYNEGSCFWRSSIAVISFRGAVAEESPWIVGKAL
ncbi:hypothetical protein C943_01356 [Mariniradius saccharolyticus AK6]|uniref:Uncharacterized protein n=1 Tax=Mariniradius saccharolyticus AK6 TaxID=1239962 RepID=M7XB19_9BACT|nr:hypothetical protein [Mariniradius saccharolyticus]EMS32094.1 hypothetical protein C943_01356 [Mariniradius saccharolyticus AK6]